MNFLVVSGILFWASVAATAAIFVNYEVAERRSRRAQRRADAEQRRFTRHVRQDDAVFIRRRQEQEARERRGA